MERKEEGFQGQKAIRIPVSIAINSCANHSFIGKLFVTDIGYFPKARFHYYRKSKGADYHILIYCTEGKGWAKLKKSVIAISSGQYIIIPAGQAHEYGADEKNPWTIYWVHFKGTSSHEILNTMQDVSASVDFSENRIKLFDEIYNTFEFGYSLSNLFYVSMCFTYFLSSFVFSSNFNITISKQKKDTSNKSIEFMQNNLHKMLSLQEIASSVYLSASRFSSVFRNKTGFSPIEYYHQLKIQKACQYLLFTDLQVQEISYNLGFEDPHYFSKMFKKLMGVKPHEYRTKYSAKNS